jgi:hypothetical protein
MAICPVLGTGGFGGDGDLGGGPLGDGEGPGGPVPGALGDVVLRGRGGDFLRGAARYLLPLAAGNGVVGGAGTGGPAGVAAGGGRVQSGLGFSAAWVNAEHWRGSRAASEEAMALAGGAPVWTSAEWGARYYAERAGARPLPAGHRLSEGDFLLTTALSGHVEFGAGGNRMVKRMEREIRPSLPLRLAGLDGGAGYATVGFGLRAFGWSDEPVDRVNLWEAVGVEPALSWVPMNAERAEDHLVEGVYGLEQGEWRWAGRRSVYRLLGTGLGTRATAGGGGLRAGGCAGAVVRLMVDGALVAELTLEGEGKHRVESEAMNGRTGPVTVTLDDGPRVHARGGPAGVGADCDGARVRGEALGRDGFHYRRCRASCHGPRHRVGV